MKTYRSHKLVEAAKIQYVVQRLYDSGVELQFEDESTHFVSADWVQKHTPDRFDAFGSLVGGYFVRYPDGYESWSPAKAFEDGYTEIPDDDVSEGEAAPLDDDEIPFGAPHDDRWGRVRALEIAAATCAGQGADKVLVAAQLFTAFVNGKSAAE